MEIVLRRDEYDRDAAAFAEQWRSADSALCDQISAAREALSEIPLTKETREIVAKLCLDLNTDGLRGDITLLRAARALAALNGASEVSVEDVCAVAPSALRHRLRRDPLDEAGSSARILRAITSLSDQHAA
jgi:magnesium chelatase subunit I